jgi:hypothetical protein
VVYQPKSTQSRAKIPLETINPKLVLPETKTEAHSTTFGEREGETSTVKSVSIDIPSALELNFPTSQSLEEYTIHSDSTPAGSPVYISCKSEEPSPRVSRFPLFQFFRLLINGSRNLFCFIPKKLKDHYTSLKTLFITYRFPLLEYLWQLSEEEEGAVKAHPHPHPLGFLLK